MKKVVLGSLLSLSATAGWATAAWGHAVQTDYFVDLFSSNLELAATYSSGEPMTEAEVLVYAPNNTETPWTEGTTDAAGQYVFLPDETIQGEWRVEIQKEGHQDIIFVPVTESGIDYENISEGEKKDVHYAEFTPELLGVTAALSLGLVIVATRRRLSSVR